MDGLLNFPLHFIVKSNDGREYYYRYQSGHLGVTVDMEAKSIQEVDENHLQAILQSDSAVTRSCYPNEFMSAFKHVSELLTYNVNDGAK